MESTLALERPLVPPAVPAPARRRPRWGRLATRALAGFAAFLIAGNVAIALSAAIAKRSAHAPEAVGGIRNFRVVDSRVWRGGAPTADGYRALAAEGVRTVVDLRAEATLGTHRAEAAGVRVVLIPVRDGQPPSPEQVDTFLSVVRASPGLVFVHCAAGVGRTGSMVAAYLVATGQATPGEAFRRTLQVGPPSLEQIAFVSRLGGARVSRPPLYVVALSRVLDAPRRLLSRLRG